MGQEQTVNGSFGYRASDDEFELTRFKPERSEDRWVQAALTVEGQFSNFDVVYAGSYLNRKDEYDLDYVDYSFYYDSCCGYGSYIYDDAGALIDPTQYILAKDRTTSRATSCAFPRAATAAFATSRACSTRSRITTSNSATSSTTSPARIPWWTRPDRCGSPAGRTPGG